MKHYCLLFIVIWIFGILTNQIGADDVVQTPLVYKKIDSPKGAIFFESFDEGWKDRWISSTDEKYSRGKWEVSSSEEPEGLIGDKALTIPVAARHYAISTAFNLDVTDKDLVVQYEVRLQHGLDCGGAYLKLLTQPFDPSNFNDQTPYTIMFGPDKCGSDSKVHFIFRHQNPITKEFEEKHMTERPPIVNDKLSHLYTLVVRANNSFQVFIDQELARQGNLLTDFTPPVIPPKEIDDPEDHKPEDWVDVESIPDPTAVKPADWDSIPQEIPDPDAEKPEDWVDEFDGEWEAPLIDNPEYVGEWEPPMIPNPEYKGPWKARQIINPNYFEDLNPHNFVAMGGLGFELWTMSDAIQFDNILVTNSKEIADQVAEKTWKLKYEEQERIQKEIEAQRQEFKESSGIQRYIDMFIEFAGENPYIFVASVAMGVIIPIVVCLTVPSAAPAPRAPATTAPTATNATEETKEAKKEEKEEVVTKRKVRKETD